MNIISIGQPNLISNDPLSYISISISTDILQGGWGASADRKGHIFKTYRTQGDANRFLALTLSLLKRLLVNTTCSNCSIIKIPEVMNNKLNVRCFSSGPA